MGHVWTAPGWQVLSLRCSSGRGSHVFGRSCWRARWQRPWWADARRPDWPAPFRDRCPSQRRRNKWQSDRGSETDENSRLLSTRAVSAACCAQIGLLQLIEDFGRPDRHDVIDPRQVPVAGCERIAAAALRPEMDGRHPGYEVGQFEADAGDSRTTRRSLANDTHGAFVA
jgi:hypothetical protein